MIHFHFGGNRMAAEGLKHRCVSRVRRLDSWIDKSTIRRQFWIILLAGCLSRLVFVVVLQPYEDLARYEMERAAISLAQTGVLGNPYAIPTGPTAHVAPLYAILLAGIFFIFGTGLHGEIVKVCVSTLLSVAPYALFPRLANSLGVGIRLGFWSGLSAALIPLKPGSDLLGDWEAPAAAALLVVCMSGLAAVWREGKLEPSNGIRQGLSWGVALLTAPAFLSIYAGSLLIGIWFYFRTSLKA